MMNNLIGLYSAVIIQNSNSKISELKSPFDDFNLNSFNVCIEAKFKSCNNGQIPDLVGNFLHALEMNKRQNPKNNHKSPKLIISINNFMNKPYQYSGDQWIEDMAKAIFLKNKYPGFITEVK